MRLGIEVLAGDPKLRSRLKGRRVALLGHPASTDRKLIHSLDVLKALPEIKLSAAFGPQHGMRGDKQDNMIESDDYVDPLAGVPVFSLYGAVRRPTPQMMDSFDVMLVDLQDVGCRIYTYFTTLQYVLEEAAKHKKEVWVLDRPNSAGRPVEGNVLEKGWESFVGAGPVPMRHGLTLGEAALWMKARYKLDVALEVVRMEGYDPNAAPGYGWPERELPWVNPSPNIPVLCTVRCYPGTVLLEGTNLSEGRGTTRPLQIFGAPRFDGAKVKRFLADFAPEWTSGAKLRSCYFEPTFHKYKGELCSGLQIHVDDLEYSHDRFRPFRLMVGIFKALKREQPGVLEWRQPPYEYEHERLPIDLLNGGSRVREWVDDAKSSAADLEAYLAPQEEAWRRERRPHLLYADG
jgi:uncharacterized protein YbbC (DUF1343 family)